MTRTTSQINPRSANSPSRHDNPFATCWTRPGALPFHFPRGVDVNQLIARLANQHWRGAIVGPHGSGKSTLLETLKPALTAAGRTVVQITLRDGQRYLPRDVFAASALVASNCLLIVDGYEQLSRIGRLRVAWHCRRTGCGVLVTSHATVRIPAVIDLMPAPDLIEQLVGKLCLGVSNQVTAAQIAASHARHGSNVREIFFDLYDRHERLRRPARTRVATAAYSNRSR
jgi:hypothetical protein